MSNRAPNNRTLTCTPKELSELSKSILEIERHVQLQDISNQLICGDFFDVAKFFPTEFIDLLILDPPYNLTKNFHGTCFKQQDQRQYASWFRATIECLIPMMKSSASIYVCSDWMTSMHISAVLEENFIIRNRITWERDKGRGAKRNWKNNSEDIWFCTMSDEYTFNVDLVKLKRRVLAPYQANGEAKDWSKEQGGNYRFTYPSNLWTDLTVPFWSMPENTDHPTQKPEKLIAKLILASSNQDDFVFDPFVGSGTSAVVAQKLGRKWCGIDLHMDYLCWATKRLLATDQDSTIQGYHDGVFWERNSKPIQGRHLQSPSLFSETNGN